MKVCVMTGAGSGIGHSVALLLDKKKQFDVVVMIGRNSETLKKTQDEMSQTISDIFECDLSQIDKIPFIIENIHKKYGRIDCLLNIAGYTDPQPLLLTSDQNIISTYTVNVFAPLVLMREAVKYMKEIGGKILNVASTAGITPRPGWLTYASSKAAIISASQTLTEELSEYGILVYCVSPGRCATKLRQRLAPNEDQTKIMQPKDVAKVICSLLDDGELCLDGQNIIIRKQIKN